MDADTNLAVAAETNVPGDADTTLPPSVDEPRGPDIVEVDLSLWSDEPSWVDSVAVGNDDRERDLAGRLLQLYRDVDQCLYAASKSAHPGIITANVKGAINGLKSMLLAIKALDKYRHGNAQRITVQYGENGLAATKPSVAEAAENAGAIIPH